MYVDKTKDTETLVEGKYYFLSRPRRFGKSLLLDTIAELFMGSKELFEGLYIHDKLDWEESYPVVRFDFSSGDYTSSEGVVNHIKETTDDCYTEYDLESESFDEMGIGATLGKLIKKLVEKYQKPVVLLIDEYDKPILDNLTSERKEVAMQARDILRQFYSVTKSMDRYLRFVMLTGVSKFSKINLFNGANNVEDITIDERFSTICGYTHHDLESQFSGFLAGVDMESRLSIRLNRNDTTKSTRMKTKRSVSLV